MRETRGWRRISSIFAERRSVKNETARPRVGAPKDNAANLRRAVEARGGDLKNGERRASRLRARLERRPDPIQVRFDHNRALEMLICASVRPADLNADRRPILTPEPAIGQRGATRCGPQRTMLPPEFQRPSPKLGRLASTFEEAGSIPHGPVTDTGEATSWLPP